MCYSDDASPPAPPVQGPVADRGDLVLTSADGNRFGAYQARPANPSTSAVVILPDVRGLHDFYRELAVRFAEAGFNTIAIDYFGRTAGIGARDESFPFREHVERLEWDTVAQDVGAAVGRVRAQPGIASVFTVGFCLGGSLSWRQSAAGHGLAGCIGFYGGPSRAADAVPQMAAPLLLLAAGHDHTPVSEVEHFAGQVRANGVSAEVKVFPDAPHSFFDRTFGQHQQECADAWRDMLDFIERHAKQ